MSSKLGQNNHEPKWDDYLGPLLAGLTAVLALIVVGVHVYLASTGKSNTLATLLLNVLALLFSAVCTIWVGRWSALRENKAFIRAALRTTYGLHEGLVVTERLALDGIARMKSRSAMEAAVAAQFWEEVLGRTLDQVRALMRRAQETIANWKEFGPEEVEQLSHADEKKASALQEVESATEQMRSMIDGLRESLGSGRTERLQARLEALEQEKERITASSALAMPSSGEVRRLLAAGAFEEAILAYSSLIAASPDNHSLYIGRARARYLANDNTGALADLDEAQTRYPNDPTIGRMREDIKKGQKLAPIALATNPPWRKEVNRANSYLAMGDGENALAHFRVAEEAGLFSIFAAENAAMAFLLLGRTNEARDSIHAVMPAISGLFLRAQAFALLALADALDGKAASASATELEACVSEISALELTFDLAESPLQFLMRGLVKVGRLSSEAAGVFAVLSRERK